jgi:hypothetical protein
VKKHPSYYYQRIFRLTKPRVQEWIAEIERIVSKWPDVTSEIHAMGGIGFLFQRKEIGHIHWNGDLDIVFGRELTEKLLQSGKVQQHRFVPSAAVTFSLSNEEDIDFAVTLLRFSQLRIIQRKKMDDDAVKNHFESELKNLPSDLRLLLVL